jgi:hypothetical protein
MNDNDNDNDIDSGNDNGYTNTISSIINAALVAIFPGPVKVDKYELIDGIDDIDIDNNDNNDNNKIENSSSSNDNAYDSIDIKFNISKKDKREVKVPYYLNIYNLSNMGLIISYFAIGSRSLLSLLSSLSS